MKRLAALFLTFIMALSFSGCAKDNTFTLEITIPAGNTDTIIYSDNEISPRKNTLEIVETESFGDADVSLMPIEDNKDGDYSVQYITPGIATKFDVEPGCWYRIGVRVGNSSDEDRVISIEVQNVNLRIA